MLAGRPGVETLSWVRGWLVQFQCAIRLALIQCEYLPDAITACLLVSACTQVRDGIALLLTPLHATHRIE